MSELGNTGVKFVTAFPVKIKLNGGIMPQKESAQAAGYDLFCPEDYTIKLGRQVIPLKFSMEMVESMKADVRPRSGNSSKGFKCLHIHTIDGKAEEARINADVLLGTVDADYRDGVGVILDCHDLRVRRGNYYIPKGWSIAQMVFSLVPRTALKDVDELDMTNDRGGGFGHTDENTQE